MKMTKQEFILFLKDKAQEREYLNHWKQMASNSDDFWMLYKPFVDWVEDDMDLREEGVVIITYNKSLYENERAKEFRTTYEDFVKNYDKTLG
jgi:hypothetical protein